MICKRCGTEINTKKRREDGSVVCPGCGTVYRPKSAPKPEEKAFEKPSSEPRQHRTANAAGSSHVSGRAVKSSGAGMKAIAAVIAALLVVVGGIAVIQHQKTNKSAVKNENAETGSYTLEDSLPQTEFVITGSEEAELLSEPTSEPTPEAVETPEPKDIPKIEWSNVTFTGKDNQGYVYEVTVKFSPWILLSNTDAIDAAWNEVSNGAALPSYDSWGIKQISGVYQVHGTSYATGESDYISTSTHQMNDAYYCMGSLSVKNKTEGWSLSEDNSQSINIAITAGSGVGSRPSSKFIGINTSKVIYSSKTNQFVGGIRVSPLMKKDSWGPVPFVIMTSELFSPDYPNGAYYDYVLNMMQLSFHSIPPGLKGLTISEQFNINPGIIGKDGQFVSGNA